MTKSSVIEIQAGNSRTSWLRLQDCRHMLFPQKMWKHFISCMFSGQQKEHADRKNIVSLQFCEVFLLDFSLITFFSFCSFMVMMSHVQTNQNHKLHQCSRGVFTEKSTRFWRFCKAQDSHLNLFCWSMYSALTYCLKRSGVDGCSLCLENNWANQSLFIGIKNGDIISPRPGARNRVNETLYGHKKDEQTSMKLKKWRLL